MTSTEIIKKLKKHGWVDAGKRGSHLELKHSNGGRTIVPHPKKDLSLGLIIAIEKQTGVKLRK